MFKRHPLIQLFFLSTFGILFLMLVMMWREGNPEWKPYQVAYYRLLAEKSNNPKLARTPLEVKQVYLPEFGRTDRCTTCHLGTDNPKMKDAAQPFRTHPDILKDHSIEIGCTICHAGQGWALTKDDAHGHVKHWEEPMLSKEMVVSTCTACHGNIDSLKGAERLVSAKQLFDEMGCIGCHALKGWGGPVSTDLSLVAEKALSEFDFRYVDGAHTAYNWVYEHNKDPQRVTPGDTSHGVPPSAMPNYQMTDQEAIDLTALVLSFGEKKVPAKLTIPGTQKPTPTYSSAVEAGRAVYQKYGCVACHGFEGRGGIKNHNAATGGEVPPLVYVREGFTHEQLKVLIEEGRYPTKADPQGPTPPLWMPTWRDKISSEEMDQLVEYLMSLTPPAETSEEAGSDV